MVVDDGEVESGDGEERVDSGLETSRMTSLSGRRPTTCCCDESLGGGTTDSETTAESEPNALSANSMKSRRWRRPASTIRRDTELSVSVSAYITIYLFIYLMIHIK